MPSVFISVCYWKLAFDVHCFTNVSVFILSLNTAKQVNRFWTSNQKSHSAKNTF